MGYDNGQKARYQHGSVHSLFKKDQSVTLYNVMDPEFEIKTVVRLVSSKDHDFIIFESVEQEFQNYPARVGRMYRGQKYLQLSVRSDRTPFWKEGIISSSDGDYFNGTSHGEYGDSGSGIFDLSGAFIRICVGKKKLETSILREPVNYKGLANHYPQAVIISANIITTYTDVRDTNISPPRKVAKH